jgi:hypothetical protein
MNLTAWPGKGIRAKTNVGTTQPRLDEQEINNDGKKEKK